MIKGYKLSPTFIKIKIIFANKICVALSFFKSRRKIISIFLLFNRFGRTSKTNIFANFKIEIILARNKKYFYSYLSLSLILILCSKNAFNVDFWKVDFEEIGNFLSDHAFLPWVEVQGVSNFRKTFFLLFT